MNVKNKNSSGGRGLPLGCGFSRLLCKKEEKRPEAAVIRTHTPSLTPILLLFTSNVSGWRDSGCSAGYYSVDKDKYYSL
jgi:hypothetical protein